MESYRQHMTLSSNPLVVFVFEHNSAAVPTFWAPLLRNISTELDGFGIEVADVPASSETGQSLVQAMNAGSGPVILFFQGVGDTPAEGGKALKLPIAYQGSIDIPNILSWSLSCISSSATHRIHNDVDLAHFFAQYPQYPTLPHVLYFPSKSYTPGGYLALSHRFASDAVFGVVPNAFTAPNATIIAQRYNITSKDNLPALLVLHKAAGDDIGDSNEFDRVIRMPDTSSFSLSYREALLFLSTHITDTVAALVAKAKSTENQHFLKVAESRRLYMMTQLIERQVDIAEEERLQVAREPIFVKDQASWAKKCVQLPKKHRCLAVFVDSTDDSAAKEKAGAVLSTLAVRLLEMMGLEAQKVSLVVVDRQGSDAVREYFDVGQNGFPDVLFLSLDRPAKYYNFVGAFSAEGLMQFVASHDAHLAKKEVSGGHIFIPRMAPKLEEAPAMPHSGNEDEGDL
nr:unnamed protein product [Leishmania braziliensis]